jgi:hypothetical protein
MKALIKFAVRFAVVTAIGTLLTPYITRYLDRLAERAPDGSVSQDVLAQLRDEYAGPFIKSVGETLTALVLRQV